LSLLYFAPPMKNNHDEAEEDGSENGSENGENVTEGGTSESVKRNSLVADEFPNFDQDGLEVEDDWKDVFDDDDDDNESGAISPSALETISADGSDSKPSGNDSISDSINSSSLMPPPPPPLQDNTSQGSTSTPTTTTSNSNTPTIFSILPTMECLANNRRPLDHSITRRIKTAGTVDRKDNAPPSWHSDAADLPHRQAMVQDM
jgi:hypothetical protein